MNVRVCFGMLACTGILIGCGGGTTGTTVAPSQGSSAPAACSSPWPLPPGVPQLAYPVPGATNVPDSIGTLIFQAYASYSSSSFSLTAGPVSVPLAATAVPTPLPTGLVGTSVYYALAVPTLAAKTQYTVTYASETSCGQESLNLGSFTTQ